MKFFSHIFSKTTYHFLNLSKEVVITVVIIVFPIFYPTIAEAGIFSLVSVFVGDKVAAKVPDVRDFPNSQNMPVLKAVINSNPNPNPPHLRPILASENVLVAEIGPAGTASDMDTTNTAISLYVIREGDTLSEIADMFDVTVNTILWANDLDRNPILKPGQTLVILPITGIQHVVKKGDTIKTIVSRYKANLEEVLRYNDISLNSSLRVGSTVIIPDAEPTTTTKSSPDKTTSSKKVLSGYYLRPLSIGKKSQGIHGHNGVDLAAPVGTPIVSAAAGTVVVSRMDGGWHGGYGNYVVVSHPNGTQTLYAHTLLNTVSVGDTVNKGQMIAKIGMSGRTTGPHVHFEVRGAANPF